MHFPRSEKLIAHVDMNSYFASVEQQANPHLRGKPLGVCAYLHPRGCVIAASVEAKEVGMKVGMSMREARELIPNAVFVQNDPPKYRAVTSRVYSILHELTDRMEHYSIDEAFLDLTGWYRDAAEASFALSIVKRRIREEVGDWLRCSVGIAPTRFLAKTASDLKKPDGMTIITYENIDDILARLDLEDVCGIGPRMRRRIERLGYKTLLDLKNAPTENLIRAFGVNGFYLQARLQGADIDDILADGERSEKTPKSVGHSYCVPDRVNREGNVEATLIRLIERAGRRMRGLGLLAQGIVVTVGIRVPVGAGGSIHKRFAEPSDDSFTLVGVALDLLRELWKHRPVNFLAVTLVNLTIPTRQERFGLRIEGLREQMTPERRRAVSSAVDTIRDRYGLNALVLGRMIDVGDEAPDRIGFRKTEGVDLTSIV
jgi:DNA polymerase-4